MRPIDAEKLEKDFTDWYDRAYPRDKELIEIAILSVEDAPTIEAEPDKDWISVKDRLPDDKERYLICIEGGRDEIAYYQPVGDKFSNYEPFWQGSSCRFTSVTHWQPLPKRPKESNI